MTESKITNPVKVIISDSGRSFVCEQWVGGGRAITPESQLFAEEYHAIADALNRVPQLEAENERLRKRCEELEAERVSDKIVGGFEELRDALKQAKPGVIVDSPIQPDPITRRDLFAAAALATGVWPASTAFAYADAMLAEAKKGGA